MNVEIFTDSMKKFYKATSNWLENHPPPFGTSIIILIRFINSAESVTSGSRYTPVHAPQTPAGSATPSKTCCFLQVR